MKNIIERVKKSKVGKMFEHSFKTLLEDEQVKFRLVTTFKILSVSLVTLLIQGLVILLILELDMQFFTAYNISGITQFDSVFFDSTLSQIYNSLWEILGFVVFITLVGMYISKLIIRPFKVIGNYCDNFREKNEATYDPDFFTDLKILTGFSEYFFLQIENAIKNKSLPPSEVPAKYKKIYKPKFEYSFFMQFFIIVLIISTVTSLGVHILTSGIYEAIVNLATDTLILDEKAHHFLTSQNYLFKDISLVLIIIHFFFYISLSFHLYGKVSSPAFAIFATMRSFLRGNRKARVHLIGDYYARPETKKLNKYLDYVEKNVSSGD